MILIKKKLKIGNFILNFSNLSYQNLILIRTQKSFNRFNF